MKIALIIYGVSWLILLIVYIISKLQEIGSSKKEPWYIDAIIIAFAPLVILFVVPCILIDGAIQKFKQKKFNKKREIEKKRKRLHQEKACLGYMSASKNKSLNKCPFEQVLVARSLIALAKTKQYDGLLPCLNKLSLPEGAVLEVKEAEQSGSGDISRVFVKGSSGSSNYNYFDEITVENSCDGAWQAYLLQAIWHILPTFWHGAYGYRTYLFSKAYLKGLRTLRESDQDIVNGLNEFDLIPEVVKSPNNGKYYVTCCYWSDWGGLIRELVEITIENNKVAEVFEAKRNVIFKYECGILF